MNMADTFEMFLETADETEKDFISEIHGYLTEKGCKCSVKTAKSGYVVSYIRENGKTLANYVMRKSGIKMRLYCPNIGSYQAVPGDISPKLKKDIIKATDCKKLNGMECSPNCSGGYMFEMDGELYKKCRSMAFMPAVCRENYDFIRIMLENELAFGQ